MTKENEKKIADLEARSKELESQLFDIGSQIHSIKESDKRRRERENLRPGDSWFRAFRPHQGTVLKVYEIVLVGDGYFKAKETEVSYSGLGDFSSRVCYAERFSSEILGDDSQTPARRLPAEALGRLREAVCDPNSIDLPEWLGLFDRAERPSE